MKNPAGSEMLFLNRDHVVSVRIRDAQIIVTTSAGERIDIPDVDPAAIEQFADDLANSVQSNFVSITRPSRDRLVDEGPEFITAIE
jgi:hypothetical protein